MIPVELTQGQYDTVYNMLSLVIGIDGADAWVGKQAGYSIVDILAKALYGLLIYKIARLKSFADDPSFAAVEDAHDETDDRDRTPSAGSAMAGPTPPRPPGLASSPGAAGGPVPEDRRGPGAGAR